MSLTATCTSGMTNVQSGIGAKAVKIAKKTFGLFIAIITGVLIGVSVVRGISPVSWEGGFTFLLSMIAIDLVGVFDK